VVKLPTPSLQVKRKLTSWLLIKTRSR
jgi:hypothetical protein